MSRRLRSHLPTIQSQLKPQVVEPEEMEKRFEEKKAKQKKYYDQGSRKQSILKEGETVRVQVESKWKPAVIEEKLQKPRAYLVKMANGQRVRRNRQHIRKTQNFDVSRPRESRERPSQTIEDFEFEVKGTNQKNSIQEQAYRTRSGRLSKPPDKLQVR